MDYGGGLENRSLDFRDRGFESHPLRFVVAMIAGKRASDRTYIAG